MDTLELIQKIEEIYRMPGYPLIFIGSFIEITPFGWTIPGGVILAVGGFFANGGPLSLFWVILSGWLGAWTTLLLAYAIGKKSGMYFVKKFKQEKKAEMAHTLLAKHGAVILSTSLLASLTRFWVAYVSGMESYDFLKFLFYSGAASLGWVSLMTVVGYLTGGERTSLEKAIAQLGILGWVLVIIALAAAYLAARKEFKKDKL